MTSSWKQTMVSLLFLVASATASGRGAVWLTDFGQAKKLAAQRDVPILVDFTGSDWCGWCMKLDEEVFSQRTFRQYAAKNLVLFKADFPRQKKQDKALRERNKQLASKYGVRGFPTVFLLRADGTVIARTGYQPGGAGAYVEHLKELQAGTL